MNKIEKLSKEIFKAGYQEDLIGEYKRPITIVGINPHTTRYPKDKSRNKNYKLWCKRKREYFNNLIKGKKKSPYYKNLCRVLGVTLQKLSTICNHIDLYKTATENEGELKTMISKDPKIKQEPYRYFLRQIEYLNPKIMFVTGRHCFKWFKKNGVIQNESGKKFTRFKDVFAKRNLFWHSVDLNKRYPVIFSYSFSGSVRQWNNKKTQRNIRNAVIKFI